MGERRELDGLYVERAEGVVRRAMGLPEGTALRLERVVVDTRALVAEIALELERSHELHELHEGEKLREAVMGTGVSGPYDVPAEMAFGPGWREREGGLWGEPDGFPD